MSSEPVPTQNRRARFSLVVGGPFHALLTRLGGTGPDGLPLRSAAILIALVAWAAPALAALLQSLVEGERVGFGYFTDATVAARFLVATAVLIATERVADGRFEALIREFRTNRIVPDACADEFHVAVDAADRRSSSWLAEALVAIGALAIAAWGTRVAASMVVAGWEGSVVDGRIVLSWAGLAASLVSGPIFFFLVLRWCWRFVVWTLLLARIARFPLDLLPPHPDRCGGLGFLSLYPGVFSGFVFALSAVVATTVLKELRYVELSTVQLQWMLGGWLALIGLLFLGPVAVFVPALRAARERAMIDYGRLAHRHHHSFRRRWLDVERSEDEMMGSPDPSSSSDLNALVSFAQEMRIYPIDRFAIVQLAVSAGLPLLVVALTQAPLLEVVRRIGLGFL